MDEIDSMEIRRGGVRYRVWLEHDEDASLSNCDADAYDDATVAAFKDDRWMFVAVSVAPLCDCCGGVDDARTMSVGGVEYGEITPNKFTGIDDLIRDHVDDLLAKIEPDRVDMEMVPIPVELGLGAGWYTRQVVSLWDGEDSIPHRIVVTGGGPPRLVAFSLYDHVGRFVGSPDIAETSTGSVLLTRFERRGWRIHLSGDGYAAGSVVLREKGGRRWVLE
jgi:hypothetical protein